MNDLGTETLTLLDDPPADRHGDPTGPPVETVVEGCAVQPRTSSELADQRTTVISGYAAFMPPGTQVKATTRVRWREQLYEVDGDVADWPGEHVQVQLKRVRG